MTLAAACVACCSGAGGATWHRSVTPDTPHRDADGLGHFEQARGDRTPADVASSVVKRELRREVMGIDCHPDALRTSIDAMAYPDPDAGGVLADDLPIAYFACGRSAIVRALDSFRSLKGRDNAWSQLITYAHAAPH